MKPGVRAVRRRKERGFVIVYLALTMVVLMAMAAFVVDVGGWYVRAQQLQRASDAAALAGVVWMPNNLAKAQQVALATAAADGFTNGVNGVTVSATPDPANSHRLDVSIQDPHVPQEFSQLFINNVSETREAVGEYDLPVPLGSPENSLGTGGLACGPGGTCITTANYWLSVKGFCAGKETGDRYSTFYDGNEAATSGSPNLAPPTCPIPTVSNPGAPAFDNPEYRSSGYTYDFELAGSAANPLVTGQDVTIEVYDPGFDLADEGGAAPYDQSNANGAVPVYLNTLWTLTGIGPGSPYTHANDPVLASGEWEADAAKVDTTCHDSWCALYTVLAGSTAGEYQLHISSQADQANSAGGNQFALRALEGDVTGAPANLVSVSSPPAPVANFAGVVDATASFVPCSTITEGAFTADPQCPEVHGDDAFAMYINTNGISPSTCNPDGTGARSCSTFYLAQVSPVYAGKTMTITLFDPGEGAYGVRVIQPDGTYATFNYNTTDPNAGATNDPPIPGADSGSGVSCVCNMGDGVGNLPGRQSGSRYNDLNLQLSFPVPSAAVLNQNGGWFKVEYSYNGSAVSDETTWSVAITANPVHLVQ